MSDRLVNKAPSFSTTSRYNFRDAVFVQQRLVLKTFQSFAQCPKNIRSTAKCKTLLMGID